MRRLAVLTFVALSTLFISVSFFSPACAGEWIEQSDNNVGWVSEAGDPPTGFEKPESKFHRADNAAPEEGGRYWKSTLISQVKDAYSVKKPVSRKTTITVAKLPASLPKFSKGVSWGVVAVNLKSGKITRGKVVAAGQDNKAGQQPAIVVFEEVVGSEAKVIASDRWYNNYFGEKRGEIAIFNPHNAKWEKLMAGMFLERDPDFMALVVETYGTPLIEMESATVESSEVDQVAKKIGFKKLQTPDGVRYTPVDIPTFRKLYAQLSLVRGYQRFLNNGGLAIGIPPEPVGAGINVATAGLVAAFDRSHNIPCLSSLEGGMERFIADQKFYAEGNALTSSAFAKVKTGYKEAARGIGSTEVASSGYDNNFVGERRGKAGFKSLLASIQSPSPTGYPRPWDYPSFWLEPKRVEAPFGGGCSRSGGPCHLKTEYWFSNTHLRLLGGEVAPNAVLKWGPAFKTSWWKYRTETGYSGRGSFWGPGLSAELVSRHPWGGTDTTFAWFYGRRKDRGASANGLWRHSERRWHSMFEWQTEAWWKGLPLGNGGKYGELFSGVKAGILTDGEFLGWISPVLYRAPYDVVKISAGPQFLKFFTKDGSHGPEGGGIGAQIEILDGIGFRYSKFFGSKNYFTGWLDPFQVWCKSRQLRAEFGIYEIPWDVPDVPEVMPAAATEISTPPMASLTKIATSPPGPGRGEVVKRFKPIIKRRKVCEKAKRQMGLRKKVVKARIAKPPKKKRARAKIRRKKIVPRIRVKDKPERQSPPPIYYIRPESDLGEC